MTSPPSSPSPSTTSSSITSGSFQPTSPSITPPTPAPSSPAESQLDGGEFFHEKDYLRKKQAASVHLNYGRKLTGVDGELDEEFEDYDDEEEEEGEEWEREERGLAEVWPVPMVDGHAYVAGEGGVRRRRTVGRGPGRVNETGEKQQGDAHLQVPKRKRIRFAPLRIPIRRRLQTLSVLWHELALGLCLTLFWSFLANPLAWPLLLPYLLHLLLSSSHSNGAPPHIRSPFLRALPIWKYYNAYFPITLHRTVALDPKGNYIFGYQPHGIISIGAWGAFVTDDGVQGRMEGEDQGGYASAPGGGFGRLFPGIKNTLLTLDGNFRVPFYREYLLAMGLGSVSRRSCEALLSGRYVDAIPRGERATERMAKESTASVEQEGEWTWRSTVAYLNPLAWWFWMVRLFCSVLPPFMPKKFHPYLPRQPSPPGTTSTTTTISKERETNDSIPQGNAITIVLGGAHESLLTLPHHYRLILRRRRGFLKLALRNPNTSLVPVLAFGENDLYETLVPERGTWLDKAQKGAKRWFGWTVPVFWARGVFNYDVGLVPFRGGIEVVCGRPVLPRRWREGGVGLDIGELGEPTEDEVDELQEEYISELRRVWDEWKEVFAPGRKGELEIVE